jgi:hypothetical protein
MWSASIDTVCQQLDHVLHIHHTAGEYYVFSEDIMKMVEGTDSRLVGEYEIIMTPICSCWQVSKGDT